MPFVTFILGAFVNVPACRVHGRDITPRLSLSSYIVIESRSPTSVVSLIIIRAG